jgi:Family of unknown function (DUF6152)
MKLKSVNSLIVSALMSAYGLTAATPAAAHHSFAMFDFNNTVSCTATVTEFRWTNPHVTLLVEAALKPGDAPEIWSLELTSPGNLTRIGWTHHSFKPGDRIELQFNPLRDGKHGGAFRQARIIATGQVLTSSVRDANETPNLK